MSRWQNRFSLVEKSAKGIIALVLVPVLLLGFVPDHAAAGAEVNLQTSYCTEPHLDVATPLNDLGGEVYIRMDGQNTGEVGGLYPQGSNMRPPQHEADGLDVASQIVPLGQDGTPDETNGKIVLVSIGMSNTNMEFSTFMDLAGEDADINPQLVMINGAYPGMTADMWVDPDADTWQYVDQLLSAHSLTPAQVQVAWVKLTHVGTGDFPAWPQDLQHDLEIVSRNLKTNYPNIKIAYNSSRTRSYTYWAGLNPEPSAYETGFAVRWMIEKQIVGDQSLNFDPSNGEVVAPYLSWGPYLWIDGQNPRSDGQVWLPEDLVPDCTHPSEYGRVKVAEMMMDFFKTDTTTVGWFLDTLRPESTPTPRQGNTPTSSATSTATETLQPPGTQTVSTNTPRIPRMAPSIYLPVVLKNWSTQSSMGLPSLAILMFAVFAIILVIKQAGRK